MDYAGPSPNAQRLTRQTAAEASPAPRQATVSRGNLAPMPAQEKDPELDALMADVESELNEGKGEGEPEPTGSEPGRPTEPKAPEGEPASIYARFKIDPAKATETEKAIAKSYEAAEKRMRQLEAQTQALVKASQGNPPAPGQPTEGQTPATSPMMAKVDVHPWEPKKLGEKFLDDIPGSLDSLRGNVLGTVQSHLEQVLSPVYSELIEARLDREFPGVITKESVPIIKTLVSSAEGNTLMDRYRTATQQYQELYGMPLPKESTNSAEPKPKVGQPGATAKPTGKRLFYRDEIQRALSKLTPGSPEHIRFSRAMQKAYDEGRVRATRTT